jgi:hypothetical protein
MSIWIIGALFSFGFFEDCLEDEKLWVWLLIAVAWPLVLGLWIKSYLLQGRDADSPWPEAMKKWGVRWGSKGGK